ncbi:four helix bundle protein [Fibrella sp. WM1]|uniref:four helix bundle protein n=1 Tax=Fibrella musci TaxID=3242485 RepID=UPI0035204CB3
MATIHRFEDLNAWKKARQLVQALFEVTQQKPFAGDYDLVRQIRRASGSVMDNIAEGFGRGGRGEFVQFLSIAKGSVTEVKSQLYRAKDYGYLNEEDFGKLYEQADETAKITDGLLMYLKESTMKGRKYAKEPEVIYQSSPYQTEDSQQ